MAAATMSVGIAPKGFLLLLDSIDAHVFGGLRFDALGGYDPGGSWPDAADERRLYPDLAKKHMILDYAVHVDDDGTAADCELGDMTVNEVCDIWLPRQINRGVWRPAVYANKSRWEDEGLRDRLKGVQDQHGNPIRRVVAWYTYKLQIDPSILDWCDGQQVSDRYLGRNIDANIIKDTFFGKPQPPKKPNDPHYGFFLKQQIRTPWGKLSERGVVERYDSARAHGTVTSSHEVHQYAAQCAWFARRVNCMAVYGDTLSNGKPKWTYDHRGSRFVLLSRRSHGVRLV